MEVPSSAVYELIHRLMYSAGISNRDGGSGKDPVRFRIGIVSVYLCNRDNNGNKIARIILRPKWYKRKMILRYSDNIYNDSESFRIDIDYWNLLNDLPLLLAQEHDNRMRCVDEETSSTLQIMSRSNSLRDVLDGTK